MKESGKNPEHFACSVKHLSEALETDLILTPAGAEPPGPHLYEDDSSISSQNGSVLLSSPVVSSSSSSSTALLGPNVQSPTLGLPEAQQHVVIPQQGVAPRSAPKDLTASVNVGTVTVGPPPPPPPFRPPRPPSSKGKK